MSSLRVGLSSNSNSPRTVERRRFRLGTRSFYQSWGGGIRTPSIRCQRPTFRQLNYTPVRSCIFPLMNDKRKQSLYFPEDMLAEVQAEATRLDRSLSWVVQRAWTLSREKMKEIPSMNQPASETD